MSLQPRKNPYGTQVRSWRREQGLTLVDLADAAGISVVHMSDIERGNRNPPDEDKTRKIAKRLGKEECAHHLIQLAAQQRRSVEIPLEDERTAPALAGALLALARRCDEGDVDAQFVDQLRKLIEKESSQ